MIFKTLNAMEIATPHEREVSRIFLFMVPPLAFSTCSVRTQTAGSAQTVMAPKTKATETISTVHNFPWTKEK